MQSSVLPPYLEGRRDSGLARSKSSTHDLARCGRRGARRREGGAMPRTGSRGSDPRPLGLTVGGRSDRTFGEATPCIKDCVLVEGQADQAVAALTLGQGIARRGDATDRHRLSDRGWASVPIASIVSFSCRSGLRRARQRIALFLLFLSPVSATRPSPAIDSDMAASMAAPPREPSLSEAQRRALALLAGIRDGITEDTLVVAHVFDRDMIAGLLHDGLATAEREVITGPSRTVIKVVRIRISDAGRRALEG
jgi:hypothetical protein